MDLTFDKPTDQVHKITLEPRLIAATWKTALAIGGREAPFEVQTCLVGEGAPITVKGKSRGRLNLGKVRGRIYHNRFCGRLSIPEEADDDEEVFFEVKLPENGLAGRSECIPVIPPLVVRNLRWSASEVQRGDVLTLSAEVDGLHEGTEITVAIYEYDADRRHDPITELLATVRDGRVEVKWKFEYHDDTDDIPTDEELRPRGRSYVHPEYFFTVKCFGGEYGRAQESGLARFKDWVGIEVRDQTGRPITDEQVEVILPDGTKQSGALDADGGLRMEDIPPGRLTISFPQQNFGSMPAELPMLDVDEAKSGQAHTFVRYCIQVRELCGELPSSEIWEYPTSTPDNPRWIYVFSVEPWGVRLRCEARAAGETSYEVVDWKSNKWIGQNQRPSARTVGELSFLVPFSGLYGTDIYVCLSRVQLPRDRLEQYIGNTGANPGASGLVKRRCRLALGSGPTQVPKEGFRTYVYLQEPISVADRAAAKYAVACRDYICFKEEGRREVKYILARSALRVLAEVMKEKKKFIRDGHFNQEEAEGVVREFEEIEKRLAVDREKNGKILVDATSTPAYEEALRDHFGDEKLEQDCVRIIARHTVNRMQSKYTRLAMEKALRDPQSFINAALFSEDVLFYARRTSKFLSEYGDILGEYGAPLVKFLGSARLHVRLNQSITLWTDMKIETYSVSWSGSIPVTLYDVQRLATNPTLSGKLAGMAGKLLIALEAINLFIVEDTFLRKGNKEIRDYAKLFASHFSLAQAVCKRIAALVEKSEREMALRAGAASYERSAELIRFTRVVAVMGLLVGIYNWWDYRSQTMTAAGDRAFGQMVGHTVEAAGASLSIGAALFFFAESSWAGPVGLLATAFYLLGYFIVKHFQMSDLERWLVESEWGIRKTYFTEGRYVTQWKGSERTYEEQLQELSIILARFATKVEYINPQYVWFGYGSDKLKLTLDPGQVSPKSRFEIVVECRAEVGELIGNIPDHEMVEVLVLNTGIEMDAKGIARPLEYTIDFQSPELLRKKQAGGVRYFENDWIRVSARLDLLGDQKVLIPRSGQMAWWSFWFNPSRREFEITNSQFD